MDLDRLTRIGLAGPFRLLDRMATCGIRLNIDFS
jgi:hypothetical protein